MSGFGKGLFLGALLSSGFHLYNAIDSVKPSNISVAFNEESKAMAAYGKLTPDLSCTEQAAVSAKVADYFAKKAKGEAKNPDFTITKEECLAIMSARVASNVAPVAKP